MSLRRLTVLLPCHSLDDFPTHLRGREASSLLSGWTALWHPSLIAACGEVPTWRRADDPPDPNLLSGELVVVPHSSARSVPEGWLERLRGTYPTNPLPITDFDGRDEIISLLVEQGLVAGDLSDPVDSGDFFALGYCYLQLQLLARAMHYAEVMDVAELKSAVVAAARADAAGEAEAARERLAGAFDLLTQARQQFYPVDSYIVDVTLIAANTWGEPLRRELQAEVPTNLLATAGQIEQMAAAEPTTLAELREALQRGTACVLGGPYEEVPFGRLSPEGLLDEFCRGRDVYERHLGHGVNVFGQFRSDTSPLLPQLLRSLGFAGALLTTFDGRSAPANDQSRCDWTAADGSTLSTVWVTPIDTASDDAFLAVSERIYHAMQYDHVATLLLAGWPGHRSPFYEDWRRSARFGPMLGKFITLDDYLAESADPEYWIAPQVTAPNRRSWRVPTAISDPISSFVATHQSETLQVHDRLLAGLADVVSGTTDTKAAETSPKVSLETIRKTIAGSAHEISTENSEIAALDVLAVNAWSFPRALFVDEKLTPAPGAKGYSIPPMGFHWLCDSEAPTAPLAQDNRLVNEHVEVVISRTTGGVQSFKTHRDRRTRASQRLVYVSDLRTERRRAFESPAGTSRMELDTLDVVRSDAARGMISARGRLLVDEDRLLARYEQRVSLTRGSRHLLLELELDWVDRPADVDQQGYLASRLVWDDANSTLAQGVTWLRQPAGHRHIVFPDWVEIARSDRGGTLTVYPLGLPRHLRLGERALDTLLVSAGETAMRFRFAIGLDDGFPLQTGLGLLTPAAHSITKAQRLDGPASGWFLHVRPRNVVVTHLARIDQPQPGFVLRLLETEGRSANVKISAWRPLAAAERTDFVGQIQESLPAADGEITVEVTPYQWIQLEAYWSR